jgi:hypothetical protein
MTKSKIKKSKKFKYSRKKANPIRRKSQKTKKRKTKKLKKLKKTKPSIQRGGNIVTLNGTTYNMDEIKCDLTDSQWKHKTQNVINAECGAYSIMNLLHIELPCGFMDNIAKHCKHPIGDVRKNYTEDTIIQALKLLGFDMEYYLMFMTYYNGETIYKRDAAFTQFHEDIKNAKGLIVNMKSSTASLKEKLGLISNHWLSLKKLDDDSYLLLDSKPIPRRSLNWKSEEKTMTKIQFNDLIETYVKTNASLFLVTQLPTTRFVSCDNDKDIIYNNKTSAKSKVTIKPGKTSTNTLESNVSRTISTVENIILNGKLFNITQNGTTVTIPNYKPARPALP